MQIGSKVRLKANGREGIIVAYHYKTCVFEIRFTSTANVNGPCANINGLYNRADFEIIPDAGWQLSTGCGVTLPKNITIDTSKVFTTPGAVSVPSAGWYALETSKNDVMCMRAGDKVRTSGGQLGEIVESYDNGSHVVKFDDPNIAPSMMTFFARELTLVRTGYNAYRPSQAAVTGNRYECTCGLDSAGMGGNHSSYCNKYEK